MEALATDATVFAALDAKVDPDVFKKTWRINSTIAKAAICMLTQAEPRSFLANAVVDLGSVMSAYNAREFHHIYPKAFLATQGIQLLHPVQHHRERLSPYVGRQLRDIGDENPATYMARIPVPSSRSDCRRCTDPTGYAGRFQDILRFH